MKRSQLVLLVLLVVQIALIVAVRGPLARSSGTSESQPLLPALASISPAKIEIHGTEDQQVTLARAGDQWVVESADGYPADRQKVETLMTTLKDIKVRRPIVRSSRYHGALKLTDREHERRVRIWDQPTGKPKAGLYLGTSPNYRITHVRRDGEDAVYEVSGLGAFDVQPDVNGWIQTSLLVLDALTVTNVAVENAKGRFEVEKGSDGTWSVTAPAGSGGQVDASKVVELIRVATELTVSEPAGRLDEAKQGFQRPAATIRLRSRKGDAESAEVEEVTLQVGGKLEGDDNKRYVNRSGLDRAGIVAHSSVQKLIEQKLSDLR